MKSKYKFHPKYIPPSQLSIKEKINHLQSKVDPEMVKDFMASYSWKTYDEDIKNSFVNDEEIDWEIPGSLTAEKQEYEKTRLQDVLHKERKFLEEFPFEDLPGEDNLLKAIAAAQIYKEFGKNKTIAKSEMRKFISNLRKVTDFGAKGSFGLTGDLYTDLAKIDHKTIDLLEKISLLDVLPATSTRLPSKKIVDPSGENISYLPMLEYIESTQGSLIEKLLPNYHRKLAQKDLFVRKQVSYEKRSQTVAILVDNSGSMDQPNKRAWVTALLFNRFKACKEGNITLYISTFIDEPDGFTKVTAKDNVEKFIKDNFGFNGGGTDIQTAVNETITMIKNKKLKKRNDFKEIIIEGESPEILIINDGEDYITDSFHPDIKLNAFCLFRNNAELKNICHRSGGVYMTVGH